MKAATLLMVLSPLLASAGRPSTDGVFVDTNSGAVVWVPAGAPWPRNAVVPSEPVRQDPVQQGGEFVETTSGAIVWVPLGAPYPRTMVRRKTYAVPPPTPQYAPPEPQYDENYQAAGPNQADEELAWRDSIPRQRSSIPFKW